MRSFFKNLPITAKSLIAPLLTTLVMVFLIVELNIAHVEISKTIDYLNKSTVFKSSVAKVEHDLAESKSGLLQALSWKIGYVETAKIIEVQKIALGNIAATLTFLDEIQPDGVALGLDPAVFEGLKKQVDLYNKSANQSSKIIEIDPETATITLNETWGKYEAVMREFQNLSSSAVDLSTRAASEMDALLAKTAKYLIISFAFALIVVWLGGLIVHMMVSRPIKTLTLLMNRLSKGELSIKIPNTEYKDEVGAMSRSVQIFRDSMAETERLRDEQEKAKQQAEVNKRQMMNKLADDFEKAVMAVVNEVAHSSDEMRNYAQNLTQTADDTNHRAGTVAAASEQAAANVTTVATATEELSASIAEITRQVNDSSTTALAAVDEAKNTNRVVSNMAQATQKIGEVVQLISQIANQTNLLALNATIEAARAGEAGKGFAVVASEVKNLASQTAKATEDITAQIGAIQAVSGDAMKAIEGIGGTIERLSAISSSIAAAVEQQSSATSEISRNVQEAAAGTKEVSSNIGAVTIAASDTGEVASSVLQAATALQGESVRLKNEVESFIAKVRIA